MKTNKRGISLIVLVITIIVMIILASAIIITLANNGIIGKANEAVEGMNEAQVREMAQLAWAELYLDGEEITEQKIKDYLKANGMTDAELNKYEISLEGNKVNVTLKGEVAGKLNKYGFYFDSLYVGTIAENEMGFTDIGFVYHEDGSGEGYVKIPVFGDSLFPILLYDKEQIIYSLNKINLSIDKFYS